MSSGRIRVRPARTSSVIRSAGTSHDTSNSMPSGSAPYNAFVVE